jgi:hypothetical protein
MIATDEFTHRQTGRRPATIAASLATVGMILLSFALNASQWFFVPLVVTFALLLWSIVKNPTYGLTVNSEELRWFTPTSEHRVPLRTIEKVRIETCTEGPDLVFLELFGGTHTEVPAFCVPPRGVLPKLLAERGVPITNERSSL